ncbi:MAG: nucleotidyltransferase [Deltaproteobacteria bacterium]|nr:MAG: nucleotidyltransferase [Deltaproteobacteria bacterium]
MRRTGVVLAAGFGSRLRADDPGRLKPLAEVAGRPLMLRTLSTLERAGCDRVVIVVGFEGERIAAAVRDAYEGPLPLTFVENARYDLANGVSVLTARDEVTSPEFVLTMADHVFSDRVADLAKATQPPDRGAALLVDRRIDKVFDLDDATKVRTEGGRIVEIGKHLSNYDAVDTGLFVATDGLFDALDAVYAARGDASLSEGIAALAREGRMRAVDIGDGFWQDVDTPEMLAHAEMRLRSGAQ